MKLYIFICTRVQRKNNYTFSNYTFSNLKTLFALLETHKEKHPSLMPVNLKKIEFMPAGVQVGSSSRTFHPEATGAGGKVQSKKLYRLKRKLLHLQRHNSEICFSILIKLDFIIKHSNALCNFCSSSFNVGPFF